MIVLGIETSCDETGVAIVDDQRRVLASQLFSQLDEHKVFGGVVPEIAARAHIERLDRLVALALEEAGLDLAGVDAIAATAGPGLIGGLMVGLVTAKAMALAGGRPLIAVNHLEAHALTARLTGDLAFPYLLLLVSGGHVQLVIVEGVGRFRRLGSTIDDAVGEAFDKVARMLGLGYPGGPAIERMAQDGNPAAFDLPRPLKGRPGCNFSFSGLKTAVRQAILEQGAAMHEPARMADLCASFQAAVADCLADRTRKALRMARKSHGIDTLVVAGGVAANGTVRAALERLVRAEGASLMIPPPALCTDNGVMVAWAGLERLRLGLVDDLFAPARARWPLDADAEALPGAGVKA